MKNVPSGLSVAETATFTLFTSNTSIIEANHLPEPASNTTWGSLIPIPRGPPRTGRNQKSERENVLFATLPLVVYTVPARLTIWKTNLSLTPSPMSGGLHLHGFGFVPGVPGIVFATWMNALPFGVIIVFWPCPGGVKPGVAACSLASARADGFGKNEGSAIAWSRPTTGAGSDDTSTVPTNSAYPAVSWLELVVLVRLA